MHARAPQGVHPHCLSDCWFIAPSGKLKDSENSAWKLQRCAGILQEAVARRWYWRLVDPEGPKELYMPETLPPGDCLGLGALRDAH